MSHLEIRRQMAGLDWSQSDLNLARQHGLSYHKVRGWRLKLGQPRQRHAYSRKARSIHLDGQVLLRRSHGLHLVQIGAELGLTRQAVQSRLKRMGIPLVRERQAA